MTPEIAQQLVRSVAQLAAPDDATALNAARSVAGIVAAEGFRPNALAAALLVTLTRTAGQLVEQGFADLGPRSGRKRIAIVARQRVLSPEDKIRVAELRARLVGWARDDLTPEEIAWLDGLWQRANGGGAA